MLVNLFLFVLAAAVFLRCLSAWGAPLKIPRLPKLSVFEKLLARQRKIPEIWKVFLAALGFRALFLLAGISAVMLCAGTDAPSLPECFQRLQRWDAYHYINLIEKGYAGYTENGQHLFLVFFPGYVWLVRLLRLVIPNTIAAGTLVSCLCYAGGCCYLYRLARDCYNESIAKDCVLYLSLFPFSFFSGLVMTEGLFLLTTTAACYYARQRKWLLYGIFGCFAALTRMLGILVVIPAVIELLEAEKPFAPPVKASLAKACKNLLKKLPALLLPLLGTAVYLLLNAYIDGDPLAFIEHQKHWYQGSMWISDVLQYVWDYLRNNLHSPDGWAIWLPTLLLFILLSAALAVSVKDRSHPASLLSYAFFYLAANYSLSWLLSAGRYLSCGFVFFMLFAKLTEKRPHWRGFLLGGEAVFSGIFLFAYVSGAQVM